MVMVTEYLGQIGLGTVYRQGLEGCSNRKWTVLVDEVIYQEYIDEEEKRNER